MAVRAVEPVDGGGGVAVAATEAPFVDATARIGLDADGRPDGRVEVTYAVAVLGLPVATLTWRTETWDGTAALPLPSATLDGGQLRVTPPEGDPFAAPAPGSTPTPAGPPGVAGPAGDEPLPERIATLLGTLLDADLSTLVVATDPAATAAAQAAGADALILAGPPAPGSPADLDKLGSGSRPNSSRSRGPDPPPAGAADTGSGQAGASSRQAARTPLDAAVAGTAPAADASMGGERARFRDGAAVAGTAPAGASSMTTQRRVAFAPGAHEPDAVAGARLLDRVARAWLAGRAGPVRADDPVADPTPRTVAAAAPGPQAPPPPPEQAPVTPDETAAGQAAADEAAADEAAADEAAAGQAAAGQAAADRTAAGETAAPAAGEAAAAATFGEAAAAGPMGEAVEEGAGAGARVELLMPPAPATPGPAQRARAAAVTGGVG
ncbi:hypothetical protein, partial [Phytohabitans suffuscus]